MSEASHFFQSKEFAEFQGKIPYRGKSWRIGQGKFACSVIKIKLPLGFCWLWVPYGPLINMENVFEEIAKIAKREKAIFCRVEGPIGFPLELMEKCKEQWDIVAAPTRYTPQHSLILDLRVSYEVLFAKMKPKGRYNIRLAQKHGVDVREFSDFRNIPKRDFDAFYALLKTTGTRDAFGVHPKSFYKILLTHFGRIHMASLFLAYYKGKVIGGIIVVFYESTAIYYYGASDYTQRILMAPYLLQWSAIRNAYARNCHTYDFFGIAPPDQEHHPWRGVTAFKKKFGGAEILYPEAFDIVYRPLLYKLLGVSRKIRSAV